MKNKIAERYTFQDGSEADILNSGNSTELKEVGVDFISLFIQNILDFTRIIICQTCPSSPKANNITSHYVIGFRCHLAQDINNACSLATG